jgi:hypothetical protein
MGVAAGSYAAIRQSEIGNVSAGSCFSGCQKISTSRDIFYIIPKLGVIGFLVGFISYFI